MVYFDHLNLSSVCLELNYYHDGSSLDEEDSSYTASLVGIAIGGFEDARVVMKGKEFARLFTTFENIKDELVAHYKNEATKSKSAIIGSINILGNPTKLIREITGDVENSLDGGFESGGITRDIDE